MHRSLLLLAVILVLCSFIASKKKPVIKGKLVYSSCATLVIQVLEPKYYSITQKTWKPENSEEKLRHVFKVANQCSFPDSVEVGDKVSFQIIDTDPKNKDCIVCSLFDNPPKKVHLIKVIK